MLRSVLFSLKTNLVKREFSDGNVKVQQLIKLPEKKISNSKGQNSPPAISLDEATAELLEKISLVGIQNEKILKILEEAIAFADEILDVDTTNVKPLVTVLENESLYLREDIPKPDVTRSELMSHSEVSQENYFVTPVGNLEYITEKKSLELQISKQLSNN